MKYGRYMSDVALLSHKIAKYCLVVTFIIVWFCVVLQGGSKKSMNFSGRVYLLEDYSQLSYIFCLGKFNASDMFSFECIAT